MSFCKTFVGHVVAVHLDTSRPADDEKISHLLNLSEINIEDQFEMRGCFILQWQSQVEGIEEIPLDSNVTIVCIHCICIRCFSFLIFRHLALFPNLPVKDMLY